MTEIYPFPLEKYYAHGYAAFYRAELHCPYPLGTDRWKEWHRGFNGAYFRNLRNIRKQEQQAKAAA